MIALRKRLVDEWNAWRTLCLQEFREERLLAVEESQEADEGTEEIEVWIDEVIDQLEEEVVEE